MDTTNGFPSGGIRVSDADRDQAIAELSEHFQAAGSPRKSTRSGPDARYRPGQQTTSPPCSPTCPGRAPRPSRRPAARCPALAAPAT